MKRRALATLFLLGCAHTQPSTPPTHAEEGPQAAAPRATAPDDPGPKLTRKTGARPAERRDPVALTAQSVAVRGDHVYVAVHVPSEVFARGRADWVAVEGDRHGVGVVEVGGTLHVRLVGKNVPDALAVTLHIPAFEPGEGGALAPVRIEGVAKAQKDRELPEKFFRSAAASFSMGRRGTPFREFMHERLGLMANGLAPKKRRGRAMPARPPRSDVGELMSLYTGMLSVDEALQGDRGLLLRADAKKERRIPIGDVEAVPLPSHPFETMIGQLPGKPAPTLEPLSARVPQDVIYLHFHDLRTLVRVMDEVDDQLTAAALVLDRSPSLRHFVARYERELALERSTMAKRFGHLAARGVALVASDPFFREGTDVSVLFHIKDEALLLLGLGELEKRVGSHHGGLTESQYTVGGHRVRLVVSADGAVKQHRLKLGDALIVSNSRAAVERFVKVDGGSIPSLAKSGDFRYMRALYPFDTTKEDGFVFLGDALVHRVTGPEVKILSVRRMEARADLLAVNHAALGFGLLEGRRPRDTEELLRSGLLFKEELRHADGEAIAFSPDTGARSAHGTAAVQVPLIEQKVDRVTEAEWDAYGRFRETYQGYWSAYIDPSAVRLRFEPKGARLSFDARMLPLIERTEYDDMFALAGEARTPVQPLEGTLMWSIGVAADSKMRREADIFSRQTVGGRDVGLGWLGDWVMVGVGDRSALWDLGLSVGAIPNPKEPPEPGFALLRDAPFFAGVHIRSRIGLAATLTGLRAFSDSAARGLIKWSDDGTYREVAIQRVKANDGDDVELSLYYGVAKDVLLLSLRRGTLERRIDDVLDGRLGAPSGEGSESEDAQTTLTVSPGSPVSYLARTLLGLFESQAGRAHADARSALEDLGRGLGGLPTDPAVLTAVALHFLGEEPVGPHGGRHQWMPDGTVAHDLYGTSVEPAVPAVPVKGSPVTLAMDTLRQLGLQLSVEGEGKSRGLHVVVDWRRKTK